MMKRFFMIAMIFMAILSACGSGTFPTPIADTLFVDPRTDLGPISPYLFGTNYGPMHAVPLDVLPLVEEAGFTALRFPGGAWTDTADMKPFQIDQLMAFAKQVDAMPTISVRLLGGEPETAAELVRYTNIEKKYGVTYWSIGNESGQGSFPPITTSGASSRPWWRRGSRQPSSPRPRRKSWRWPTAGRES